MADVEQTPTVTEETPTDTVKDDGGPSEKEANKPPSPKPDTEVAPPLVSVDKRKLFT